MLFNEPFTPNWKTFYFVPSTLLLDVRAVDADKRIHGEYRAQRAFAFISDVYAPPNRAHQETVVKCFSWVIFSHSWGTTEPGLHDIQDKVIYDLDPVGTVVKLQKFCKVARDAGYRWAWSDTWCIDRSRSKNQSTPCSSDITTQRPPSSTYRMSYLRQSRARLQTAFGVLVDFRPETIDA
ncbi:uncharacterized protein BJ212DRAFT_45029 [Suillus subaureus]|uniref:Heterokaryon incompatibility domain-containing protein n=1 Tax=Suillus subaureus TaxID=48587 RepID=A0A9P7EPP1_9AGAM|nr:uncharacterized protein BJ212DRAFT_45029 [Suillus subaureus]KAG1827314.1 hypothetical protein BJ212DRAFT_45029 [Suillus subaureus]